MNWLTAGKIAIVAIMIYKYFINKNSWTKLIL